MGAAITRLPKAGTPRHILALDASLACCSAAILADGRLLAHRLQPGERGHAATLPPLVDAVLREAGVAPMELAAVAVVVGPGGFTGVRTAVALAQGLALGAGVPALGVTTGEALAAVVPAAIRAGRAVWAAVDNRRGRVALERFASTATPQATPAGAMPEGPPEIFAEADLPLPSGPVAVAGDAAAVAARLAARGVDVLLTGVRLPDAAAAARVAAWRLAGLIPPREAQPLYLEPPAARAAAARS